MRVLQDQVLYRVGGNTQVGIDVRVIGTTTKNLVAEIKKGKFREDLYYRLNVVPIQVPPLNARREDIALLAEHFLEHASKVNGLPGFCISDELLSALQSYDWPGNVRELRNIIERMLILAPTDEDVSVVAEYLPAEFQGTEVPQFNPNENIMLLPLRAAREQFEHSYLSAQVKRFDGNISRTAEFVGMERSALHRKLKSLGVV